MSAIRSYSDINRLAKETKRRIPALLAMSGTNDPFYVGPMPTKDGEWFATLWTRLGIEPGAHLRRVHYRVVSQAEPVLMRNGQPYQNTVKCWEYLQNASKSARYLGLVPAEDFVDKRNPDPVIVRVYEEVLGLAMAWLDDDLWFDLPRIKTDLADLDWPFPEPTVSYIPTDHDAPLHLEFVSEKSTMDDIVVPLLERLGVNYAPATGYMSVTGTVSMLRRIRESRKDAVVFYLSDFDPAGSFMAPAVARQIEFWLHQYTPGQRVLLVPVALTKQQVIDYDLPPIPIKESDNRAEGFKECYGVEGATELDALEALHPGALARIVERAVKPYRDPLIARRIRAAGEEANQGVGVAWRERTAPLRVRLDTLKSAAAAIADSYRERLEALADEMREEMEPLEGDIKSLRQAIENEMASFEPDLPERPVSSVTLPEAFDGLFDSRRDYLEQLGYYKASPCANPSPT